MKVLLWLYHILCLLCHYHVVPQPQKEILSSNSMISNVLPSDDPIEIPWLVSMPGNCQGIVLSRWLILSTANCLRKTKLSHMDISGVNDPESIPHDQTICLHPTFDPQAEKDTAKGDIGLVLLEEPIIGDDIPLSHASNISLKSCSKCQYRSCHVYEYQSSKKLGTTRVKKVSVQLLDLSACHHQQSYLEKNEGLCIQSPLHQDCWIQRASPVLCLLKNQWELVGLMHKTSRICHNPAVIIRTAPYLAWMKRFIKASKKLLDPTSYLHCRTLHQSEYVPQIRHSNNYPSTLSLPQSSGQLLEGNVGISPQPKHIKNFPTMFHFSNVDSLTDRNKFLLDNRQTIQPGTLLEQVRTSPVAELVENPSDTLYQYNQDTPTPTIDNSNDSLLASTTKSSLSQLITDTVMPYTSTKVDADKPWGFPLDNSEESFDKIMADIVKQWSPSTDDSVDSLNSNKVSTTSSWAQPHDITGVSLIETTANMDDYMNSVRANTAGPYNQPTVATSTPPNLPLSDSDGPWKYFTSENVNTTAASLEPVERSKPSDSYFADSTWVPLPSGTIEPWSSSPEFYALSPQDQPVTDTGRSQSHPIAEVDGLQVLTGEMGLPPTHSKMVTYGPMPANIDKFMPYRVPYNKIQSQNQNSFRSKIQPVNDIES